MVYATSKLQILFSNVEWSVLSWLLISQLPASDFDFDVQAHQGLTISAKGLPLLKGSGFQYYAPGWSKGYYSSRWNDQSIRHIDGNTIELKFNEGGASGTVTYRRSRNRLSVDFDLNWNSNEAALIELNEGLVWVPPFQNGKVTLDGTSRTLPQLPPVGALDKRILGNPAKETVLASPVATLTLTSSEAASTFDGRKYDQDWAELAPVYWQGILSLPVHKGTPTIVHLEYAIAVKDETKPEPRRLAMPPVPVKDGVLPNEVIPPLIPNPKMSFLDYNNTLTISNLWKLPAGRPKFFDLFRSELEKRFELPEVGTLENRVSFDGGMSDFKQREGTYHVKITKDSISVYGQEVAGLRNGIYRLAKLAFIRNGKICLPTGVIEDEPRSDFRGVHLFVGPQSIEFQQRLWNNVLRPLGFNKVVLQCERTDWNSAPAARSPITMKQADLAKLFNWYRTQEVEPIPLIQSLGHMEWFFEGGSNAELAVNPKVPYTIDSRRQEARDQVGKLWDEAIQLLKPRTIHVGLDEIDMRGFATKDSALTTELWKNMVPYLGTVAKRNNVNLMLWGDEGLAPKEAIDATNGDDADNAAQRRKAIPKGTFIADWHYRADQNHVPFLKSLQRWKLEGFQPIASTWYRPENIRGFDLAADVENVGTLQTTWPSYDSSEATMLKNLNQFSAFILAGDYGWSGRSEKLNELPYNADEVFARMYNPKASPLTPAPALLIGRGEFFECGGIKFSQLEGTAMMGISPSSLNGPDTVQIDLTGMAKEAAMALTCEIPAPNSERIGEVTISYKDGSNDTGPLLYGLHLRADSDDGATFYGERRNGRTCLRLNLRAKELKSITVHASNRFSGIRFDGLTLIPIKGKKGPA